MLSVPSLLSRKPPHFQSMLVGGETNFLYCRHRSNGFPYFNRLIHMLNVSLEGSCGLGILMRTWNLHIMDDQWIFVEWMNTSVEAMIMFAVKNLLLQQMFCIKHFSLVVLSLHKVLWWESGFYPHLKMKKLGTRGWITFSRSHIR